MTRKSKSRLDRDTRALTQPTTSTPPLGRKTPPARISRWDRLGYSELRFPELTSIIRDAEQGRTEDWADLTRRMLKTDPDLRSVVRTRIDAVASARWELSPPERVRETDAAAAAKAVELCTAALSQIPRLAKVLSDLLDAIGMGYAVAEILWERRDGLWMPVELAPIHPRRICFSDSFEPVLRDEFSGALEGERVYTRAGTGVRLTPNKYLVHQPGDILDYPTAAGLYMASARYWWVKQWVLKYWLTGAETAGNPRYIGKYPQAAPSEAKEELFEALEELASDGIGVMSVESSVEILAPLANGSTSVWQSLLGVCDSGYAKLWLGSTLNVDVSSAGGSRALGESQADTTIDPRKERDGAALMETVRDQLLRPFLAFNSMEASGPFAGRMPPVPVGRFIFAEDPVEVDDLVVNAGVVTVDELRQSRGLPPIGGDYGKQLVTMQPAQPAYGSGFGGGAEVAQAPLSTAAIASRFAALSRKDWT